MNRKEYLNRISKYGLMLAAISAAFSIINSAFTLNAGLALVLSFAKLASTIWVLYYAMKKYACDCNLTIYSKVFSFGLSTSIMSAIAYSLYCLLHFSVLFPIDENELLNNMQSIMGPLSEEMIQQTISSMGSLPEMVSSFMLIYLTMIGVLFSLILAAFAKNDNPFGNREEQNEDKQKDIF